MLSKITRPLNMVDSVILVYTLLLTFHTIVSIPKLTVWDIHLLANLGVIIVIYFCALTDYKFQNPVTGFIHTFYPIFLLMWLYPQACMLRHIIITFDLDSIIFDWEMFLFQQEWYRILPTRLNLFLLEFFHAVYFFYYIGLAIFAMLAFPQQIRTVQCYLFTLISSLLLLHWVLILFPTSGPVYLRPSLMPEGVLFIPVMNWIYANLDQGGGAFPSLHAAAAVIMSGYAINFFPK